MYAELFDAAALAELYARIGGHDGICVRDFQHALDDLFARGRKDCDVQAYRERVGEWKKLKDEVVPIAAFLRAAGRDSGRIRFPLDSEPYDAWLTEQPGAQAVGIETTVALARGQVSLAKMARSRRMTPGFLGVPDRSSKLAFAEATRRPRTLHARNGMRQQVEEGIRDCLRNKNRKSYEGGVLLISAPLPGLSAVDWVRVAEALKQDAAVMPFDEVFCNRRTRLHLAGIPVEVNGQRIGQATTRRVAEDFSACWLN